MDHTGQTALITGASSGIGYELAKLFAKDGYNLVLTARSVDRLNEIAQQFKQEYGTKQITVIGQDLSRPEAPRELYDQVKAKKMTVNVLVNNAGMGEFGHFATETDLDKELSIIQLNVTSLVHLTKLFLKDMVARNEGKILNLASIASVLPHPVMAVYGATKFFVYSFSESLVNELKDTNVTVTALLPGPTDTDFFNKAGAQNAKVTEQVEDVAKVAKDGYEALMAGKDKVISGFKNKMQVTAAHLLPDQFLANYLSKQMEPKDSSPERTEKKVLTAGSVVLAAAVLGLAAWAYTRNRSGNDFRFS